MRVAALPPAPCAPITMPRSFFSAQVARNAARSPVVPRRLRIPLLGEIEEDDGVGPDGGELESGRPLDVLGHRAAQEVNDVGVAPLESGRARRLVGHALEDEPL